MSNRSECKYTREREDEKQELIFWWICEQRNHAFWSLSTEKRKKYFFKIWKKCTRLQGSNLFLICRHQNAWLRCLRIIETPWRRFWCLGDSEKDWPKWCKLLCPVKELLSRRIWRLYQPKLAFLTNWKKLCSTCIEIFDNVWLLGRSICATNELYGPVHSLEQIKFIQQMSQSCYSPPRPA